MTAEGAAAGLANCTSANLVVRVIDMVILIKVHRRLELVRVERIDLETGVVHWIRTRNHGLRSRYGWIERYVTGGAIILDTASRPQVRRGLKAIIHIGSTLDIVKLNIVPSARFQMPVNPT